MRGETAAPNYELNAFERASCAVLRSFRVVGAWLPLLLSAAFAVLLGSEKSLPGGSISKALSLACVALVVPLFGFSSVHRKYLLAFDRGDAQRVRELGVILYGPPLPKMSRARIAESIALLLEGRYAEARDMLAKLPQKRLIPRLQLEVMSNLAYATSLAGDPKEGIVLARAAVAFAKKRPPRTQKELDVVFAALGVALSLAGEHEEAVDCLAQVEARPGASSNLALRGCVLGTSLLALKRHDDAMAAFARAAAQSGPWAERAKTSYAKTLGSPHRA